MTTRKTLIVLSVLWVLPTVISFLMSYLPIIQYPPYASEVFVISAVWITPGVLVFLIAISLPRAKWHNTEEANTRNKIYRVSADFSQSDYQFGIILCLIYLAAELTHSLVFGQVLELGVTGARYAGIVAGGQRSAFGGIALFLSGAPAILAVILIDRGNQGKPIPIFLMALVAGGFASLFLGGGRNGFAINSLFVIAYIWLRGTKKDFVPLISKKKSHSLKFWMTGVFSSGAFYSLYLFLERSRLRSSDYIYRLTIFENEYGLQIPAISYVQDAFAPLLSVLVSLQFYTTSSFYSLSKYFHFSKFEHTNGAYTFFPFVAGFDFIFGTDISFDSRYKLVVNGLYYSLPGGVFIDFGFIGLTIFAFSWCAITIWAFLVSRMRRGAVCLLSCYVFVVMICTPMFGIFGIASGPSLAFLILIFILKQRLWYPAAK